VHYRN
jgi:hypothetical protein